MRLNNPCSKIAEPNYPNEFQEAEMCPSCTARFKQLIAKSQEHDEGDSLLGFNSRSFTSIDWKDAKNTVIVIAALFVTVISFIKLVEHSR